MDSISDNKRIAKNTLLLYVRTIFVMGISLYIGRVVLKTLGVDDFGIYSVVGGVVAMLGLMSNSLSTAISRFVTFELGRGDIDYLKKIFTASVNIQVGFSILVIIAGETIGLWFLNTKMNIPPDRLYAANWVLHCSIISFILNLVSTPYNAIIIAHERMSAFAYISILEVILKLIVVSTLIFSPWDRLITYSVLLVLVSLIIRLVYGIYCRCNFDEARYIFAIDKDLIKSIGGFAGWGFFLHGISLLNTNGVSILVNMFFTVSVNGAMGIAQQVQSAFLQFVKNFTTALNPQITKLYASGKGKEMFELVIRGSKFSFYLSLMLCLPIVLEADYLLQLWLGDVPGYAVIFVQLSVIGIVVQQLGDTGYTACMATGKIRNYSMVVGFTSALVFPLTFLLYKIGYSPEATYIIYIMVYMAVNIARLMLLKKEMDFPIKEYIIEVYGRVTVVSLTATVLPLIVTIAFPQSFMRIVFTTIVAVISTGVCCYFGGLSLEERSFVYNKIVSYIKSKI